MRDFRQEPNILRELLNEDIFERIRVEEKFSVSLALPKDIGVDAPNLALAGVLRDAAYCGK